MNRVQQSADILKLDIDCFEEAFDYLPLEDLFSVGRTCKRLYQVVGHILQQIFLDANAFCSNVFCTDNRISIGGCDDVERFAEFITKISIDSDEIEYFLNVQSKFRRLKQIEIAHLKMNAALLQSMKPVLQKVKRLRIDFCKIEGSFHDTVLTACPNLTHLYVSCYPRESTIIGSGNGWLLKTYPKLEHVELVMFREPRIKELKTFLELNPNITTFLTFAECLWANRESMLSSNIQLNELGLYISEGKLESFDLFFNLLNELHERGFYKRLNLSYGFCWGKQNRIDQMASLNAVVKLNIKCSKKFSLSAFNNIEELYIMASKQLIDLEAMATNLIKLKRIHFGKGYVNHIRLLISRAANLSKIIVDNLTDKLIGRNETVIIELAALNREREKLPEARQITLYVEEEVYLATKWAMNRTDFNLLRLKRRETYEADKCFNIYGFDRC